MVTLNPIPFPLFLTLEKAPNYGHDIASSDSLDIAGHLVVGASTLAPSVEPQQVHLHCALTDRINADAVRTTDGELRFEYTAEHLRIILDLAAGHGIRAWDAAAFIAHQVLPDLTVLDSDKTPVKTLEALPKHDGVDQESFHAASNFPLSVVPPPWFPKAGMPNVTVSGWHG
ncbi:hypothetical protein [Microbacterium sp. NPDC087589]|uniref:hypothetical protein n=1 Tax=Microbacterium sp. NPDC087589 TaxID=3364191 RepID=UPI0038066C4C